MAGGAERSPTHEQGREEMTEDGRRDEGKRYGCRYCERVFLTAQALGGHQNCHREQRAEEARRDELTVKYFPVKINRLHPTIPPPPPSAPLQIVFSNGSQSSLTLSYNYYPGLFNSRTASSSYPNYGFRGAAGARASSVHNVDLTLRLGPPGVPPEEEREDGEANLKKKKHGRE